MSQSRIQLGRAHKMLPKVRVANAALEFAQADQAYIVRIHQMVHRDDGKLVVPSDAELEGLSWLRSKRDEAEQQLYRLWVGEEWTP